MSLDLGGPAIEIAIALSFVFFILSLIVTALTEWIAAALKLRAKTLREGLEGMLGDKKVADNLLCHPLVRSDLRQGGGQKPSYIAPRDFALALQDVVDADGSGAGAVNPNLTKQLSALSGSGEDGLPKVPALERWFDQSMNRVSGWYKRKSQKINFAVAILLVLGLNASTLRVAERLFAEPNVRAAVVAKAEAAGEEAGAPEGESGLKKAGQDMEGAVKNLDALKLPIFWAGENVPHGWGELGLTVVGWAITVVAISLGAPFWFDALGKLSHLRMAGKKPEAKAPAGEGG